MIYIRTVIYLHRNSSLWLRVPAVACWLSLPYNNQLGIAHSNSYPVCPFPLYLAHNTCWAVSTHEYWISIGVLYKWPFWSLNFSTVCEMSCLSFLKIAIFLHLKKGSNISWITTILASLLFWHSNFLLGILVFTMSVLCNEKRYPVISLRNASIC